MHNHYSIRVCWIWLYIYFTNEFYTSIFFSIVTLCPFISTWKTPVSISWKAGLVVMNSLSFCLFLGMSLYLHFWRTVLQSVVLLVGIYFFLLALWIYHSTPSWSTKFLLRNPLIALWGFPYMWWAIFPLLLSKFSLALIFNIFNSCRFPFVFFILSFFIFFLVPLVNFKWSVFNLLILSSAWLSLLLKSLFNFSFLSLYSSAPGFVSSFLCFLFLYQNSHFVRALFYWFV